MISATVECTLCPSCAELTCIESTFIEEGEEQQCRKCTNCKWWGT